MIDVLRYIEKMKKSKVNVAKIKEQAIKDLVEEKGLDKKMVEDLVDMFLKGKYPDYQKVKALKNLPNVTDEGILELENIVKNLATKDRKLNATGGRVPLGGGKLVKYATPEGLAKLIEKFFPGTTKLGKTSKPMSPKTELKQSIAGFQEREAAKNKIISHSGSAVKAGKGRFTKAEVLIQRLENTIKDMPDDKYVQETFPNFIKEIKADPKIANNENVWKNLGMDLPKDQQLVVHGDDTVDFFRQTEFGPHNIEGVTRFHEKHPFLTRKEAVKISKMEPTDQVMELTRLETIRSTKHSTGGRVGMAKGGLPNILKL